MSGPKDYPKTDGQSGQNFGYNPASNENQSYHYGANNNAGHNGSGFAGPNVWVQPDNTAAMFDSEDARSAMKLIIKKVFLYMASGLALTFLVSALIAVTPLSSLLFSRGGTAVLIVVSILQLGVVLAFSAAERRCGPRAATAMYYIYAVLTGLTFSIFFVYFDVSSLIMAFAVTAVVFGAMAFWGANTKRNLTTLGTVGYMLLIGALLVTVVNLLLYFLVPQAASALAMILNYVVLAIFIGLTAYDMNRIKQFALQIGACSDGPDAAALRQSAAIHGALTLYLDFINIFIRILAIFGRIRD